MKLSLVMGDQLSMSLSALTHIDKENDVVLMCEVWDEATYVKHHKKKIVFLFSAMRHFAEDLKRQGYRVFYTKLDDPKNTGSFRGEIIRHYKAQHADEVVVTFPGEYRVLQDLRGLEANENIRVNILPDDRFLSDPDEFANWAKGRKQLRMEYFYREMRRKHNVLLTEDGKPIGDTWNYDHDNRNAPDEQISIPKPYTAETDEITQEIVMLVQQRFPDHFGDIQPFHYGVTRQQALYALNKFIEERLPDFGKYQDAMLQGEAWMYHSHISLYMNCGLLLAKECIAAAEQAYHDSHAPLNAVEGFIRQILGWREYVRGIYWLKMPEYQQQNFFDAQRKLPSFYWDANTKMNCLKQCVTETKANAYAHHIQRLMVLGNFALLAGIHPDEVNAWFLIVYADAYQWVELPNVSGMTLFADGGDLASKPYAASGNYINKMSNYCRHCEYSPSKKTGKDACPFNYLYWDFLMRNQQKLEHNPRMGFVYKTLERMGDDKKNAYKQDAEHFLNSLG